MLTKVYLEGPMGKEFGREWELEVRSPNEALRLIDVNHPGVFRWIRENLDKYSAYKVVCEYESGKIEELDEKSYILERQLVSIRFIPMIEGAGDVGRIIVGVALIALAWWNPLGWTTGATMLGSFGASLVIGGVVGMLTPKPDMDMNQSERKDKTSYYFDGPANTSMQGVPVQLIYGRLMVGSHAISASLTIDQLM